MYSSTILASAEYFDFKYTWSKGCLELFRKESELM